MEAVEVLRRREVLLELLKETKIEKDIVFLKGRLNIQSEAYASIAMQILKIAFPATAKIISPVMDAEEAMQFIKNAGN